MKTAKEMRSDARNVLKGRYWRAFIVGWIATILGGVALNSGGTASGSTAGGTTTETTVTATPNVELIVVVLFVIAVLAILFLLLMGGAVELGYNVFNLKLYESAEKPPVKTLFCRFNIFWKAIWLRIYTGIKIVLWTMLLIIPGIIASFRYAMAPYIMADDPTISAVDAVNKSKVLMNGNKARLFRLYLSFIGWIFLSLISGGIGFLFLTPYIKAAEADFYVELKQKAAAPAAA